MIHSTSRHFTVAFYHTHYECLGHTTRVLTLIDALKKKIPEARFVCLQGSKAQSAFRFPSYIATYQLPHPLFSKESFRNGFKASFSQLDNRRNLLLALVNKINISMLITEYFPLGRSVCAYELLPALALLAKRKKIAIASAGYPVIMRQCAKELLTRSALYKKIFIHTPEIEMQYVAESYKSRKEKERYIEFFKECADKITFTGYVKPSFFASGESPAATHYSKKGGHTVLITRGAGAYYPEIITAGIAASEYFSDAVRFIIVAGPLTGENEWRGFKRALERKRCDNALLLRQASAMNRLFRTCDVCVAPASYNSSVLIMYYRKKAVLVPFEGYGNIYYREQPSRARLLRDYFQSEIIEYPWLSPKGVAKKIRQQLAKQKPSVSAECPPQWFFGKKRFAQKASALLAE